MPEKKGKLVEIKTKPTTASVENFINSLDDEQKRQDCFQILEMMRQATGEEPRMWGGSIIGFGEVRHKSPKTGREVDWLKMGFSPRKANISLYLMTNLKEQVGELDRLGKHKTGVGCLYIKKLEDVNVEVLEEMIKRAAGN